ncbi:Protein of unknown function [Cribrihabitans marinus]|uniref:Adenylate cyclase n=1 Tax=Cribrihabitans marinus TaxID=1227549 RepID=A0A1H7C5H7_9RHOB|nr:DUF3095 domain-containing protein [Cribrihabitans marinus]GGH33321.1 hypothetical protein GCM10010973_25340 [Cribrihabitans marinus]SEJ82312.1 Protein of unknown function [Cribrihabitans marinus]
MSDDTEHAGFYESLPRIASFAALTRDGSYVPLPDGWVIGAADIVGSTELIAEGRYKMVNVIGAAVISSQINADGRAGLPFVFGGDGAVFACGPERAESSRQVLGIMARWAQEEFGVTLRAAQVPVADIRAAGLDVRVARYQAAPGLDYAMFAGGGVTWSEAEMKAGRFAVPLAAPGSVPDLTGLSCRWNNARSRNGVILSLVLQPAPGASLQAYAEVADRIVAVAERLDRGGHPLPPQGSGVRWPPPGLELEAHVSRGKSSLAWRKVQLLVENLIAWVFFKTGLKAGGFDPVHYAKTVSSNADFRKFDDGLKMTLDCDSGSVAEITEVLERADADGTVQFGLFEQDEAMITCFVPSVTQDDHVHLIDGAAGGYARAAAQLKSAAP